MESNHDDDKDVEDVDETAKDLEKSPNLLEAVFGCLLILAIGIFASCLAILILGGSILLAFYYLLF